jgi:signal transduction histidine kinase
VAGRSLRFRLLGSAAVIVFLALQIAGLALVLIFERHLVRATDIELEGDIDLIASVLRVDPSGNVSLASDLADPRFRRPFSGRYWQISRGQQVVLSSRSLLDAELDFEAPPEPGEGMQRRELLGPDNKALRAAVRSVTLAEDGGQSGEDHYVLVAAINRSEIQNLKSEFASDVFRALGLLGLLLVAAAWFQVTFGLRPFEALRTGLERVRVGLARRLDTNLLSELQPLVHETNKLLEAQERAIAAARERAGNLAHGLKTPLTALAVLSKRLREKGQADIAEEIEAHVKSLDQHVERELARSRIAAEAGTRKRAEVAPVIAGLVRTMLKLPRGSDFTWPVECPDGLSVALDEADLTEALGNLIDNARKWARSRVSIQVQAIRGSIEIVIEDDGAGMPAHEHARAMQRGKRLDETVPGSGLGLSIAKEIIEAYAGTLVLRSSTPHGLQVCVTLPKAA